MNHWIIWLLAINLLSLVAAGYHIVKSRSAISGSQKEWSREDLLACILSALAYLNCLAGTALLLMNQWTGYALTAITVAQVAAMFYIIDPKLRKVSDDFENKQQEYLEELDKIVEWEKSSQT